MKIDFKDMKGLNIPKYCRKIMKEEGYPKTLEIYRGEMLCLTADVEKCAKLTLDENTLYYKKYDESEARRLSNLSKKQVGLAQGDV